jgi:hypothetical protein
VQRWKKAVGLEHLDSVALSGRRPSIELRSQAMPIDVDHLARLGASVRLRELEAEITTIRRFLGKAATPPTSVRPKRTMSASARKRISRAQKARWAKLRAKKG